MLVKLALLIARIQAEKNLNRMKIFWNWSPFNNPPTHHHTKSPGQPAAQHAMLSFDSSTAIFTFRTGTAAQQLKIEISSDVKIGSQLDQALSKPRSARISSSGLHNLLLLNARTWSRCCKLRLSRSNCSNFNRLLQKKKLCKKTSYPSKVALIQRLCPWVRGLLWGGYIPSPSAAPQRYLILPPWTIKSCNCGLKF